MKKEIKVKAPKKDSLSKRLNKTAEDIAMLEERKSSKKKTKNVCDHHWDGA